MSWAEEHQIRSIHQSWEMKCYWGVTKWTGQRWDRNSPQKGGEDVVRRYSFCSLGIGDAVMPLFSDKPEKHTYTEELASPIMCMNCVVCIRPRRSIRGWSDKTLPKAAVWRETRADGVSARSTGDAEARQDAKTCSTLYIFILLLCPSSLGGRSMTVTAVSVSVSRLKNYQEQRPDLCGVVIWAIMTENTETGTLKSCVK